MTCIIHKRMLGIVFDKCIIGTKKQRDCFEACKLLDENKTKEDCPFWIPKSKKETK